MVGAIILGPRIGKYGKNGGIKPIMGHNMPLATIGVFLLWFGWYGFNGGSVLSADPAISFTCSSYNNFIWSSRCNWCYDYPHGLYLKKPDLSMILNGSLAGLVSITAGADIITPITAMFVGFLGGMLVVLAVIQFDKLKIDDPVGAISVHLVCGIWGTLAVGIFSKEYLFQTQLIGVLAYGVFCLSFLLL